MKCVSISDTPPLKHRVPRICEYINACPQCSCAECDVYVGREAGQILCCTEHMFTKEEIEAARKYSPPVRVIKE